MHSRISSIKWISTPAGNRYVWMSVRWVNNWELAGRRFERDKVAFAKAARDGMTNADLDVHDLRSRVEEVCAAVREWNA